MGCRVSCVAHGLHYAAPGRTTAARMADVCLVVILHRASKQVLRGGRGKWLANPTVSTVAPSPAPQVQGILGLLHTSSSFVLPEDVLCLCSARGLLTHQPQDPKPIPWARQVSLLLICKVGEQFLPRRGLCECCVELWHSARAPKLHSLFFCSSLPTRSASHRLACPSNDTDSTPFDLTMRGHRAPAKGRSCLLKQFGFEGKPARSPCYWEFPSRGLGSY